MTHVNKDGHFIICREDERKCSVCGSNEECRPYGKGGADICFDCAMKDEETTKQMFQKRLDEAENNYKKRLN